MPLTDQEWDDTIAVLKSNLKIIESWPETTPEPAAERCQASRHRTLAHLRAAQETWLQVLKHINSGQTKNIKLLHPWRLFTDNLYQDVAWHTHHQAFVRDRKEWLKIVQSADFSRSREGKFNGKLTTLDQLTNKLAAHESHHLKDFK